MPPVVFTCRLQKQRSISGRCPAPDHRHLYVYLVFPCPLHVSCLRLVLAFENMVAGLANVVLEVLRIFESHAQTN